MYLIHLLFLQKEPELLSGNDVLWTFVNFAGEDHTNFHTLVAFLKMLGALVREMIYSCFCSNVLYRVPIFCSLIPFLQACSEDGASKVFELLQGKTFRSVSWSTLFDCLSIYAEKFKQSLQSNGSSLPEFPEGDAKALVAYLTVIQKVCLLILLVSYMVKSLIFSCFPCLSVSTNLCF